MKKHAFLIIAHNEFMMLKKLIGAIDDYRNDIYIHIDKKVKKVNEEEVRSWANKSNIYMMPRRKLYWGTYSIVDCELRMLKMAVKNSYQYYHLLSGVDLPLKTQDEFHEFFDNQNSEFLEYHNNGEYNDYYMEKLMYYYPFLRYIGKGGYPDTGIKNRIKNKLNDYQYKLVEMQKKLKINRIKKVEYLDFCKGGQWFSITGEFANYVLTKRKLIKKLFRSTNCPDEFVFQTIAMNSHFKYRTKNRSYRKIDWNRGKPYCFNEENIKELLATDDFFARKVSYENSPLLVERILSRIKNCDEKKGEKVLPLISVIVPCYNVEKYLRECVNSILAQTYENLEIILVDDGSKDSTGEIINGYVKEYRNIKGIMKLNGGLSSARNDGIDKAKGEYIAFVDSDDWLDESYIEDLYKCLVKYNAKVAVCGYTMEDEKKREIIFKQEKLVSSVKVCKVLGDIYHSENVLYTVAWNKLYHRSIFKKIRFAKGRIHEDVFAAHRVIQQVDNVAVCNRTLYHYRIRQDSITAKENKQDIRHLDYLDGLEDRVLITENMLFRHLKSKMLQAYLNGMYELMIDYNDKTYKEYRLGRYFRDKALYFFIKCFRDMSFEQKINYFKICIYPTKMRKILIAIRIKEEMERNVEGQCDCSHI